MADWTKADDVGINIKAVLELLLMAQRNYMMAFQARVICIVYDECLMMMIDFAKVVFCFKDLILNNRGIFCTFRWLSHSDIFLLVWARQVLKAPLLYLHLYVNQTIDHGQNLYNSGAR